MNTLEITKDVEDDMKFILLTDFVHLNEVNELIDTLDTIIGSQNNEEKWEDRLQYIFNQYQMQPHLLDPYLEILLQKCIKLIGQSRKIERKQSFVFRLIYLMVKTRGYKTIIRLMPHEVSDLEPVLSMLCDEAVNENENWQARYVLLLWLSIVVMIPFDLKLFDSADTEPIALRIIKVGKSFLISKDVSQSAAAFMLSKFLSRPDNIKNGLLSEMVDWALTEIKNIKMDAIGSHTFLCGLLRFLTYIYKFGKREDLLMFSTSILETNNTIDCVKWEKEILLCQLRTKLVQRIGLVFLKMKVISWRYQRGNRVLLDNLVSSSDVNDNATIDKSDGPTKTNVPFHQKMELEEEESMEISEHLPEVIDFLINSLKNYFTFVRWSAAKGIGRICSRLPKMFADDVVEAILVLFSRLEGFSSWHGGCLAMAELGRRGLLLPQRLPEVLPLIVKALFYDEKSGECSYGANVRDAACYVCWSFARAYNPEELQPYVVDIAVALIMVTLFDRQVTVRRAASAAFQENVGRQGQFPHGIDILTTCDYFAVGNISNCFLTLSVFIASFKEYVRPMIDHLVELKVGHWDYNIRELTAKALNKLLPFEPEYMIGEVLPSLMKWCSGLDLYRRQGAIMSVGELIRGMANPNELSQSLKNDIKAICHILDQRMQFRGLSGELMRKAVCHLIFCCSEVNMSFHGDPIIDQWLTFLNECAIHKEKLVRTAAIDAFPSFLKCYGIDADAILRPDFKNCYLDHCCHEIVDTNIEYIQQTYLIILGKTPQYLLQTPLPSSTLVTVLGTIMKAARIEVSKAVKWGEARSCAVTALIDVCETMGIDKEYLSKDTITAIYDILLTGLDDYTFDSHGDIGALVREASMRCLLRLNKLITTCESRTLELLDEELCRNIMVKVAQQAVEKIDRVRNTAGTVFYDLLYLHPPMPFIPHRDELESIFVRSNCDSLYWAAPHLTFPLFCRLLHYESYRYRVWLGLVVSVGGLTEKIVQHSRDALHRCLKDHEDDEEFLGHLCDCIIRVFHDYRGQDRVICPLLKAIDFIHSDPIYNDFIGHRSQALIEVIDHTKTEVNGSRDILKIKSAIEVLCTMLQFEENVSSKTLGALMVLIGHKFPIIRKHTATYIYQSLLMYDVLDEERTGEVMELLQETIWDNSLTEVREVRNTMCKLFGIAVPKPISAAMQ